MFFSVKINYKLSFLLIGLLLMVIISYFMLKPETTSLNNSNMEFVVVIDPGHGSIDTGTSYRNIYEKDINLTIGKYLYQEMKQFNIKSILTRAEDKLFMDSRREDIKHRPQIALENNADLFISIHANNFPSSQPSGSQVFYKPGSSLSKELAKEIKRELVNIRKNNNRSIKNGDFYVLNKTPCPAVLIEVGFLSNPEDRKLLTDPKYQKKIAVAIRKGVVQFFLKLLSNEYSPDRETVEHKKEQVQKDLTLYYLNNNLQNISLVTKNLSYPSGSILKDKYASLKLHERLALVAIEQLSNPPEGLISPLPENTVVQSLKINDGIAIINLSKEVQKNFNMGAGMEEYVLKAITNTLFSIPGIEEIEILIDGQRNKSIGGHILLDKVFKK